MFAAFESMINRVSLSPSPGSSRMANDDKDGSVLGSPLSRGSQLPTVLVGTVRAVPCYYPLPSTRGTAYLASQCVGSKYNMTSLNEPQRAFEGEQSLTSESVYVSLTYDELDASKAMARVKSPKAGAVVLFAGTCTHLDSLRNTARLTHGAVR